MKTRELLFSGVKLLEPKVFSDMRGWSMESYSAETFRSINIENEFILRYESYNREKGTLRGIHFQDGPAAHCKLVQCVKGVLWDVIVDLRKDSPTFGQWTSIELNENDGRVLYLPVGIGHGYVTLSDDTRVVYLIDQLYSPEHAKCIVWNDDSLNIRWPVKDPILSEKDRNAPKFEQCSFNF